MSSSARLAGAGMVFMGVLTIVLAGLVDGPTGGAGSAVLNLILGLLLVARNPRVLTFCRIRAWLGLLLGTPIMWVSGGAPEGVTQLVWSLSMIALLGHDPGRARKIFGIILMMGTLALGGLAAGALKWGVGPLNSLAYQGKTEPLPADLTVLTCENRLEIRFPDAGWSLMKREEMKAQNPDFDLWAARTAADIHVAVLYEHLENGVTLQEYQNAIVQGMTRSKLLSQEAHARGTLLHFHERIDDLEFDRLILLMLKDGRAYQVHAWALSPMFAAREKELRAILAGVRLR